MEKETGINFDYILALKSMGRFLTIDKIKIARHDTLIDEMFEMYENIKYDAIDMILQAKNSFWTTKILVFPKKVTKNLLLLEK